MGSMQNCIFGGKSSDNLTSLWPIQIKTMKSVFCIGKKQLRFVVVKKCLLEKNIQLMGTVATEVYFFLKDIGFIMYAVKPMTVIFLLHTMCVIIG